VDLTDLLHCVRRIRVNDKVGMGAKASRKTSIGPLELVV